KASAGTLAVNRILADNLRISSGTLVINTNGAANGASSINTLTTIANTHWDLGDNDLRVTTTPQSVIERKVIVARAGGTWTGKGIGSSAARANVACTTSLGVISGADYLLVNSGTFDGFAVNANDTLVKYTWNGDANFSGTVNFDDYVRVDIG